MLGLMFGSKKDYSRGEISVSDPGVRSRLQFMGITEVDLGVIAAWESACKSVIDDLVDAFYAHIQGNPATSALLQKHSSVERQRPMLTKYVLTMFSGRIDDQYIAYRKRVGVTHDNIDLDATWYIAMYQTIRQVLEAAVAKAGASKSQLHRFTSAFTKLVEVDIALCSQALMDSRRDKLEAAREAQAQRSKDDTAFINQMADVLGQVASRQLTVRAHEGGSQEQKRINEALNKAVSNLDEAMQQVALASSQVASAAGQISSGSQTVAQGASQQASSLSQITDLFNDFSAVTIKTASKASEATAVSEKARVSTGRGAANMKRLSQAMEKIKGSSDATSRIVKTIDEIAFQTNLLALNAAVEAARAGDAGRGFAVVAEEVRKLAQQAADAAKETTQLIQGALESADEGVSINSEVLADLEEINSHVSAVNSAMGEIASGAEQQQKSLRMVNESVDELNRVTQQNAASSEESASAAQELSGQAAELQTLVDSFALSDGASGPGWESSPKATKRSLARRPR